LCLTEAQVVAGIQNFLGPVWSGEERERLRQDEVRLSSAGEISWNPTKMEET
jgi:hypothetical protein